MTKLTTSTLSVLALSGLTSLLVGAAGCASDSTSGTATEDPLHYKVTSIRGTVTQFGTNAPLAGAKLCVINRADIPCATVAANGQYTFGGLPWNSEFEVIVTATGVMPHTIWLHTDKEVFSIYFRLVSPQMFGQLLALTGHAVDPSKGTASVTAYTVNGADFPADNDDLKAGTAGIAGADFALVPAGGTFTYFGTNGLPNNSLTETSAAGFGVKYLAAGDYAIDVGVPAGLKECNHRWLAKDTSGNVKVRIRGGHTTGTWTRCLVDGQPAADAGHD